MRSASPFREITPAFGALLVQLELIGVDAVHRPDHLHPVDPLYIQNHHYLPHEIVLAPGVMVLYEGARLAHGRPKPLDGDRFANFFVHFRRRQDD